MAMEKELQRMLNSTQQISSERSTAKTELTQLKQQLQAGFNELQDLEFVTFFIVKYATIGPSLTLSTHITGIKSRRLARDWKNPIPTPWFHEPMKNFGL